MKLGVGSVRPKKCGRRFGYSVAKQGRHTGGHSEWRSVAKQGRHTGGHSEWRRVINNNWTDSGESGS